MPDDRSHLIPIFSGFGKSGDSHPVVKCLFCEDDCVDFVLTASGFACHDCIAVCVEIVVGLAEPPPPVTRSRRARCEAVT
jgi:hypothetical protein